MQLSIALMETIASMLLWVLVGYVVVKTGLVKGESSKVLSTLTVYVFCPAMIFNALQIELTKTRMTGFLACTVFAVLVYVVWTVLSRALRKPMKLDPVDEASLVYGNVGNLTLPLVSMTLGPEMMFYASAMQIPFNLFFWTHGISVMQRKSKFEWKKVLLNPNLIALAAGLLFLVLQWHLPSVVQTAFDGLTAMVAPASMMVVGMVLAGTEVKSIITCKRAYGVLLGRLILYPLLAIGLLFVSGVITRRPELAPVLMVICIAFAAPTAANVSQLAVVFDQKPEEASIYNILSLFACILTIPALIALYQFIFM